MKKVSEMFKLYREFPIFKALYSAMLDLAEDDQLPISLVPVVVHKFDQVVVDTVKQASNTISFYGKMTMYRRVEDHSWFVLSGVTFYQSPSGGVKEKSRKKGTPQRGKRLFKVASFKMWVHNPVSDGSLMLVEEEGETYCPYTVQVERRPKETKKVAKKVVKELKPSGGYNPLIHVTQLGKKEDPVQGEVGRDLDWRRPMPYNEKLRRAKGEEELAELGASQVGQVEVLRGKWRKRPKEWPHRCVEQDQRVRVDLHEVSGNLMASRTYACLMRSQDRDLAELTVSAAGTLALTAHNVHVMEQAGTPRMRQARVLKEVRDGYGTRRRNKIQLGTYDSTKNFAAVVEVPKSKRRLSRSSSSSSSSSSSEESSDLSSSSVEVMMQVVKKGDSWGRCVRRPPRPKSKQINSPDVPKESLPDDDLDFLDELVIDAPVENFDGKDIMSEEYLLEQASSSICDNNNIFGTDIVEEKGDETKKEKKTVHSEVKNSNEFLIDLFNTKHDLFHRDLEEFEGIQDV